MTDKEIIKALQCCLKTNQAYKCTDCRYYNKTANCLRSLMTDTVDLINRQQTEIEQLKKVSTEADNFARTICNERTLKGKSVADFEDLQEYVEKQKTEAIKDFGKLLIDNSHNGVILVCDIPDYVVEMVGEVK